MLLTKDLAVQLLDALDDGDPEAAHGDAEEIVMAFLRASDDGEAVANAFERAQKRVGFWYA